MPSSSSPPPPVHIRRATDADLPALTAMIVAAQTDPERSIGYLEEDAAAIRAQLRALEPIGLDGCAVAVRDGHVIGLLAGEWDHEPPRVWWHGPIVEVGVEDVASVEDALYLDAVARLPASVTEQELFHDARSRRLPAFAQRHGFRREPASAVLLLDLRTWSGDRPGTADGRVRVRAMTESDRPAVAALHDEAFPGAHLPGHRLDGPRRHVVVAEVARRVVGYLAVEQQLDGQGYLDFLAVDPSSRRQGIAGALVGEGLRWCRAQGADEVHLTVREENHAARALYDRLGFREQMIAVPWRIGTPVMG